MSGLLFKKHQNETLNGFKEARQGNCMLKALQKVL
jgi:hypothetical protein